MFKNILIVVLVIGCIVLFFWKPVSVQKAEQIVKKNQIAADKIEAEVEIIAREFDERGVEHAKVIASNEVDPEQASYIGVLDTAAIRIKIQAKQIESLTIINSQLVAKDLKATKIINDLGQAVFKYKDKYVDLSFRPPTVNDTLNPNNDAAFDFTYNADLEIVQYQKRKWFLGEKRSYIDIASNDARTTISGVKRLTVRQDRPAYGLRAQAMTTYNINSGNIMIGPAIRFDAGRFSIQAARLYNPSRPRGINVVALTYDGFIF
jgi:hypothetical protein